MSNEKPVEGVQPVSPPAETSQPARPVSLQRSRAIGRGLRELYSEVAQEPVPDSFMAILEEADENAAATGKPDALKEGGSAKIFVLGANVSPVARK